MDTTTKVDEVKGLITPNDLTISDNKKLFFNCESLHENGTKRLLIMAGCPGTGKTTIAKEIRKALDKSSLINRDKLRNDYSIKPLLRVGHKEAINLDQEFFSCAENRLSIYNTVILDATFRLSENRRRAYEIVVRNHCETTLIQCVCQFDTSFHRLEEQVKAGIKKFKDPIEQVLKSYWDSFEKAEGEMGVANMIKVDTEKRQVVATAVQPASYHFINMLIEKLKRVIR